MPTPKPAPSPKATQNSKALRVILAQPRGFCAGVDRAIAIVKKALEKYGAPVYVRHEIVHNTFVVDELKHLGAVFVQELDEIPDGAHTIFSAHGVSDAIEAEAQRRGLPYIDAACPLVSKVHRQGQAHADKGEEVILIGHAGHPEVEGTLGRIHGQTHLVGGVDDVAKLTVHNPEKLAYVTQTTLSVDDTKAIIDALTARFPAIKGPDLKDICYATQNRQQAARALACGENVDLLLVIGGKNSSNSNRLREIGADCGVPSHLIDDADALDPAWLDGVNTVGITAGASAPEVLVQGVLDKLATLRDTFVENLSGVEENMHFKMPIELRDDAA
jgi:4-hydroxy-3-methylbut-2-enyl diphosphate reductase